MAYDKVIDSSVLDGNLLSIANAIREKAELTENFAFPQGFIDAINGISAGGDIRVETGTITFSEDTRTYTFTDDTPDIFIIYSEDENKPIHSDVNGIAAAIQREKKSWIFGKNKGTSKYYLPYYSDDSTNLLNARPGIFDLNYTGNFYFTSGVPLYRWVAIYGVTI